MANPILLHQKIVDGIKNIICQSKDFTRPIQHEFIQQELYKFLREESFDTYFEYEIEYHHIYRTTKKAGEVRLIKNGRIDLYAEKNNIGIAIEFDSGATIKWKSLEKLLQSNAQYCFGIVSGPKTNDKLKLDMYDEKNLWKFQLTLEDHIPLCDKNRKFDELFNLQNKKFWLGNIKRNFLTPIDLKDILSSSISLQNLKNNSRMVLVETPNRKNGVSIDKNIISKYVVIFKLENGKWYIGRTNNLKVFIENIKCGNGPPWIQINKFISVHKVIENGNPKALTLEYMKKFGWQNVRGYAWSQKNMMRPPIALRVGNLRNAVSSKKFNETVYILKLEQNKWFLGKCLDEYLTKRIDKQKNGLGNQWTKTYRVIGIDRLVENGDLKELTLEYMKKYGWRSVRGYSWTQKKMKKPPRELLNQF